MIRAANTVDLLRLFARGPQPVLQFDAPQSLIRPRPGLRTVLQQLTHPLANRHQPAHPIYVASSRGRIAAYVRGWSDYPLGGPGASWTLLELGNPRRLPLSEATVTELLEAFCHAAAECEATRLFARLPDGADWGDTLASLSFQPYAEETVWAKLSLEARPTPLQNPLAHLLRRRDAWSVYQLYLALTPEKVQHSEGYSSQKWQLGREQATWGGRIRRYVWDEGRGVQGYLQISSGTRGHELKLMTHPNSSTDHDLGANILDFALNTLHSKGERAPVYCTVRDYQSGLDLALAERGFRPLLHQTVFVKHIAVQLRQPAPALRPVWSQAVATEGVPASSGGLVMNDTQQVNDGSPLPT